MELPPLGHYATGILYLDKTHHHDSERAFAALAEECGLRVLCWRTVPTDATGIGDVARNSEPFMRQVFVSVPAHLPQETVARMVSATNSRTYKNSLANETRRTDSLAMQSSLRIC